MKIQSWCGIALVLFVFTIMTSCINDPGIVNDHDIHSEVVEALAKKGDNAKIPEVKVESISDISFCGRHYSGMVKMCDESGSTWKPSVKVFARKLSTQTTRLIGTANQIGNTLEYRLYNTRGPNNWIDEDEDYLMIVTWPDPLYPDPCDSPAIDCDLASDGPCDDLYIRDGMFLNCVIDPGPGPGCC